MARPDQEGRSQLLTGLFSYVVFCYVAGAEKVEAGASVVQLAAGVAFVEQLESQQRFCLEPLCKHTGYFPDEIAQNYLLENYIVLFLFFLR